MKRHIALFTVIAISLALLAGGSAAVLYTTPSVPFWLPIAVLAVLLIGLLILLLIYILKPNYQKKFISSTLIWKLSLKYKKKKRRLTGF